MQTITVNEVRNIVVPDYGVHFPIDELIAAVKRSGSHFFDADTMRFFRSRVDDYTFAGPDGWYFVTSEKHESAFARINESRKYTVRCLRVTADDLKLYELGGFQAYGTLIKARTAARHAANIGAPLCEWKVHVLRESEARCTDCQRYADRQVS